MDRRPDTQTRPTAVPIVGATITLQALLKLAGAVDSGGEAKQWIQGGLVTVNGVRETRRRHALAQGDTVTLWDGRAWLVTATPDGVR